MIFCGALVDRHGGAYVDNRCLPYPTRKSLTDFLEDRDERMVGWSVTRWQVEFFRLLHSFEDTFDPYEEGLSRVDES